ncbi:VanZ family protein [Micrococcus porci]|uniref:VanZ family protein n=1 Tax=Micrococcus porci TaxID=2856555 RepID=UPI001CCCC70C|nr:VanZ family protein [Micrococcus porci]UBH25392.1 VanZ family protein [Micrococcus porci]
MPARSSAPAAPPPSAARRRTLALLLVIALAAHLVVLYLPGDDVPAVGFEVPGMDKAIHVATFGVPALLGVLLARRVWPAAVLAVHAPLSEVLQAVQGLGRTGDPADAVADLAGVALGLLAARAALRRGPTGRPIGAAPGRGV